MDCSATSPYQPALAAFSEPSQCWILQYLDLLATRRYAPATLTAIVKTLAGLLRYLPQERQGMLAEDITQATAQDISAFLSAGLTAGLAPSTLNTKLSILAGFFAYLCDEGVMRQQPVSRRRHRLLTPAVLPKAIPDADRVAFFQVIDSLRDRLLFLLMLRCGLRVSAACALTWDAIDRQAGTVRINQGKGRVDRVVYCSADVAQALQRWQQHHSPGPYVFPSPQRRRAHLLRALINRLMDHSLAAAGLTTHYSPHC
jgi:site-specific recombinase XerD